MLAISLHAVRDDLRDMLVPINKKISAEGADGGLPRLSAAWSNARRITFEYVMLKDVNGQPGRRQGTGEAAEGHSGKINLIPFNPWPGTNISARTGSRSRSRRLINQAGTPRRSAPARPRHSCRLRTAQVGIGTHAQGRPPRLRGDDDRQSRRGLRRLIVLPQFRACRTITAIDEEV